MGAVEQRQKQQNDNKVEQLDSHHRMALRQQNDVRTTE